MDEPETGPITPWEVALCALFVGGVAGFLVGRFAIGPLLCPVGSHLDGYEDLEWLGTGIVSAVIVAPLGAILAYLWSRRAASRR